MRKKTLTQTQILSTSIREGIRVIGVDAEPWQELIGREGCNKGIRVLQAGWSEELLRASGVY